jgi:hypothetical protein
MTSLKTLTYHRLLSALNVPCNCAAFGCSHDPFDDCDNHKPDDYAQGGQSAIANWLREHPDPVKFLLGCGYELHEVGNLLRQADRVVSRGVYHTHEAGFPVRRAPLDFDLSSLVALVGGGAIALLALTFGLFDHSLVTFLFGNTTMTTFSSLVPLSIGSLVCHDLFGLGYTISPVQATTACAKGKVEVVFDDDDDATCFDGRVRVVEDDDGNPSSVSYRVLLVDFLDWDNDDESETQVVVRKPKQADELVAETDDFGFDKVESIEAIEDEVNADSDDFQLTSHVPRVAPLKEEEPEVEEEEDGAAYEAFLASEFDEGNFSPKRSLVFRDPNLS